MTLNAERVDQAKPFDEPAWLTEGRRFLGLKEIPGKATAPFIAVWLKQLGAWWTDDETPWCGVACAGVFRACGVEPPKDYFRARAWASWGTALPAPAVGCVVVFEREGGGHVGIVVGKAGDGRLLVWGGNQGNAVSIAPFDLGARKVLGYRWPTMVPFSSTRLKLPVYAASGASSTNEA